jgi:hypothetical protein
MAQKESLHTRVTRLEDLHADLAVKMIALAEAQIKTETTFQATDERIRNLASALDERIGKLVSAIGELIARMPDGTRRDEQES